MQHVFKYIIRTRERFLELIEGLTIEQLNTTPEGFNNNIIWNFGHIVVAATGLSYVRTGIQPDMEVPYQKLFGKGTRPVEVINQETINALKQLLLSSITQIKKDAEAGVFDQMKPYSTATYGYEMADFHEVLTCILAHDNLHYGYAKAQLKQVSQA